MFRRPIMRHIGRHVMFHIGREVDL